MAGYGSNTSSPGYIESVVSTKNKTKEHVRTNQVVPEEILSDAPLFESLLEAYYEFLNLKEFLYNETIVVTDLIASGRAVFRISDPKQENNKFFSDDQGGNSTLTITNTNGSTTQVTLNSTNVTISNGNDLPGSLSTSSGTFGKTFTVTGLEAFNNLSCSLSTLQTNYVLPNPSYVTNTIEDSMNIDNNTAEYLEKMQKEIAASIPRNLSVEKRGLYKTIVDLYKVKGSQDSIEIFFRLLFDEAVEVQQPYDKTLIPSSGNYDTSQNRYLDNKGFLSDSIKIQDSLFYQKFSYLIRTGKNTTDWANAFTKLIHPAGFKFFGEILLKIELVRAVLGDDQAISNLNLGSQSYENVFSRLNRLTLSSMPGLQPGVIGLEDLAFIMEILAPSFNPNVRAKIFKSAGLSVTLGSGGTAGQVTAIEIASPGFGYATAPTITITGDGGSGATATCTIDNEGQVDTVTITAAGSGYTEAFAGITANVNSGKVATLTKIGGINRKYFVAPTIVIKEPQSFDEDGNPLATNVTATATFNLASSDILYTSSEASADAAKAEGLREGIVAGDIKFYKGEITSITPGNVGNGYVNDPEVTIRSDVNNEIRATGLQPILILLLNHVTSSTLENNNFFNRKTTYNAQSFFRNNQQIQFFGDKTIESNNESLINKYNIKSNILT